MKKTHLRLICILLSFLLLALPLLCSCAEQTQIDSQEPTEAPSTEQIDQFLIFVSDKKSNFKIIRPADSNQLEISAASLLQSAVKSKFGTSPAIKSDTLESDPDTLEILIGTTSRKESQEAAEALGSNGYLIKMIGKKLAIVGTDSAATKRAVEYFICTYITTAKETLQLSRDLVCIGDADDAAAVKTNGDGTLTLDLRCFVITYDLESVHTYLPATAAAFASRVKQTYEHVALSEDANVNKYEILFGKCDRVDYSAFLRTFDFRDFSLIYKNGKLSVHARSIYGYEQAIKLLESGFDGKGLTLSEKGNFYHYDYGNTDFGRLLQNYEHAYDLPELWTVSICHRGDVITNANPENSLPSYQSCIDNKIDVIEIDLRKTSDGVWVMLHDATLDRTTNGSGKLSDHTYEEISKLQLRAQNGGQEAPLTDNKIPTLTEVIELCRGKVLLNLDKLDLSTFGEVYEIFASMDAVDIAMFKTTCEPKQIANWFCELIAAGKELPLFSPMVYGEASDIEQKAPLFRGLTTMVETANGLSAETLSRMRDCGIRPMCLTALNPSLENNETWTMLIERGYGAIMIDSPVAFSNLVHTKT